jgi:hypothetical protein
MRHSGMCEDERPAPALPEVALCEEKHRLLDAFLAAIHNLNEVLCQQTQAVVDGDPDFNRFDVLIHMAQQAKDNAKYAWIAHVEAHGCGG